MQVFGEIPFVVAALAVLFAGVSKGGFGSGAAFASAAVMALFLDPWQALAIMLPLLMLIDVATLNPYWRQWSAHDARILILGSLPGVAAGVALYQWTEPDVIRLLIGAVSLGFVVWRLAGNSGLLRVSEVPLSTGAGLVAGGVAGFTSFVSHAGGPPAAIYLLSRQLGKTTFQATTVLVFWAVNIAKFIPYAFLGLFTLETATAGLALAPFALIGAWAGVRAHRIIPENLFFLVTYILLSLTGAKLIWDGLT